MSGKNLQKIMEMMEKGAVGAQKADMPPMAPKSLVAKTKLDATKPSFVPRKKCQDFENKPPFISAQQRDALSKQLKTPPSKVEIEVGFGIYDERGSFRPGVSVTEFNLVMNALLDLGREKQGLWGVVRPFEKTIEETENKPYQPGVFQPNIKRITNSFGDVVWQEKRRHTKDTIENQTWGYRISKSDEKLSDEGPANFNPNFKREKERRTFLVVDRKSDIFGVKFDLTRVRETREVFDKKLQKTAPKTEIKYEIEIERKESSVTLDVFERAISIVILAMQRQKIDAPNRMLLSTQERNNAVSVHNYLFSHDENMRNFQAQSGTMVFGYWNKPENISVDDLLNPKNQYAVTLKIDGTRCFILSTDNGIYACSPPRDIWKIGMCAQGTAGTLLDAEIYVHPETGKITYYVFDVLFLKGRDMRQKPIYFTHRLAALPEICRELSATMNDEIVVKNFYGPANTTIYESVAQAFEEAAILQEQGIALDGLIFQSQVQYRNFFTRKWKPPAELTIDFKFKNVKGDIYQLYTDGGNGKDEIFKGSDHNPQDDITVTVPDGIFDDRKVDEMIIECRWVDGSFVPVRFRDDRSSANYTGVAKCVWDDIANPISEETIRGDSLIAMRRFHNLIKSHFLEKEFKRGDSIMDWGSGRGGDIGKWKKLGLSKVFVVEPNETNFEEFERRRVDMEIKALQIEAVKSKGRLCGAEETDVIQRKVKDINGVVSFFSLTFFGKDKTIFDGMINTLDKTLDIGGKFVGIVMDGERVAELLENSRNPDAEEDEALVYDCPAFTISQVSEFVPEKIREGKNEIEITIKDPTSMVDQTEWLFYFDILKTRLEKLGFVLNYTGFLDENDSPDLVLGSKTCMGGKKTSGERNVPEKLFPMLPNDGKSFSSLNRYFCFTRKSRDAVKSKTPASPKKAKTPKKETSKTPEPVEEHLKLPFDPNTVFDSTAKKELFLIRAVPDTTPHAFVHTVLAAFHKKYRDLSYAEKKEYVTKLLVIMSKKVTKKLCKRLTKFLGGDPERYDTLRLNLIDRELSCEVYADILSHILGINVLVITKRGNKLELDRERGTFECHDNTIVIFREPMGTKYSYRVLADSNSDDKIYRVYQTKSNFIEELIYRIAKNKSDIQLK